MVVMLGEGRHVVGHVIHLSVRVVVEDVLLCKRC
jgi:hypothetical protein